LCVCACELVRACEFVCVSLCVCVCVCVSCVEREQVEDGELLSPRDGPDGAAAAAALAGRHLREPLPPRPDNYCCNCPTLPNFCASVHILCFPLACAH